MCKVRGKKGYESDFMTFFADNCLSLSEYKGFANCKQKLANLLTY